MILDMSAPYNSKKVPKANIFYQNIEPESGKILAQRVENELLYILKFLERAIRGMDIRNYCVNWKKEERYYYTIQPEERIRIAKPKNLIKLNIPSTEFDKNIPIIDLKTFYPITHEIIDQNVQDNIVIEIIGMRLKEGQKLSYKNKEIEWTKITSEFPKEIKEVFLHNKKKVAVKKVIEKRDYYEIILKENIPNLAKIRILDNSVDYVRIESNSISNCILSDKIGDLDFYILDNKHNKIITTRQINGVLRSNLGDIFNYQQNESNYDVDRNGIWILLQTPEEMNYSENENQNREDIFLDILSTVTNPEIWENARPKPDEKIKVIKIDREDSKILIKREPNVDLIYPPDVTFQLEMQKKAVQTLLNFPTIEHRPLLKLFENRSETSWDPLSNLYSESDISFRFLTSNKESTPSQKEFVLKALNTPDFAFLEGPPGSGKTTAITELIYQLILKKKRVLLASSTNVAVDNVLEKLISSFGSVDEMIKNKIIPLRIGKEEKISEDIKNFQFDNRINDIRTLISNYGWFKQLDEVKQNNIIQEWVCWASNIVCGTTLGVLKYPHIYEVRGDYIKPEFDYLIIDEASKTTFQEFLVPAIHAKHWIIVGDVRQLSPFTDTLYAQINLDNINIQSNEKKALLVLMKLLFPLTRLNRSKNKPRIPDPKFIYIDEYNVIEAIFNILKEKLEEDKKKSIDQQRFIDLSFVFISNEKVFENQTDLSLYNFTEEHWKHLNNDVLKVYNADVVFCDKDSKNIFYNLPNSHLLICDDNPNDEFIQSMNMRHNYYCKTRNWSPYAFKLPKGKLSSECEEICEDIKYSISQTWAGELVWRMKRVYELQFSQQTTQKNPIRYYDASMRALLPIESNKIWKDIKRVARIFFPSIISSLQEGVTQFYRDESEKTILSSGFEQNTFNSRHILLEYQNRMHPKISSIPRELFYKEINALIDTKDIEKERYWDFEEFKEHRFVWRNVEDSRVYHNTNEKEAKEVFKQLKIILSWINQTKNNSDKKEWSIALLTFYEKQRVLFRDMLRKLYPSEDNIRRQTQFRIGNTKVYCYTIDKVQGREADIVILSMVQNSRTGFMDCPNRLNVALTRAKYLLIIVGDRNFFLSNSNQSNELTLIAQKAYCENQSTQKVMNDD